MNSLQFEESELKRFGAIVGFSPTEIKDIGDHIDDYYKEWFEKKVNRSTGEFKKYKDGTVKERVIRPSLDRLKILQRRIKNRILTPIPLPDNIHGGVKGRSNITNAKPHKGNKYQFATDLQDFYPSISHDQVFSAFLRQGFTNPFSHWITKLSTWKFELPQGTPTSTHIANIVFLQTDEELIQICQEHGITYTRYVDDLTFSSPTCFKHVIQDLLNSVTSNGFKISYRKTIYKGKQNITGIDVLNNAIKAPEKIINKAEIEMMEGLTSGPYTNYLKSIEKINKQKTKR